MARNGKEGTAKSEVTTPREKPQSAGINVKTSRDFAQMMSTLMSDILENRVEPRVANAVCNAGGKLLRMVELEHKYGTAASKAEERVLSLAE